MIYFSSQAVYSDLSTDLNITEETKIEPMSLYGASKFAGECVIKESCRQTSTPFLILRPCMVFGPRDTSTSYGPARFIRSILEEGRVLLFGEGSERRDYLFVRDLAQMTLQLAFSQAEGVLNLTAGQNFSFQEIVETLRPLLKKDFEVSYVKREKPKTDLKVNPAKLRQWIPNFSPTDFKKGLQESMEYFFKMRQNSKEMIHGRN